MVLPVSLAASTTSDICSAKSSSEPSPVASRCNAAQHGIAARACRVGVLRRSCRGAEIRLGGPARQQRKDPVARGRPIIGDRPVVVLVLVSARGYPRYSPPRRVPAEDTVPCARNAAAAHAAPGCPRSTPRWWGSPPGAAARARSASALGRPPWLLLPERPSTRPRRSRRSRDR